MTIPLVAGLASDARKIETIRSNRAATVRLKRTHGGAPAPSPNRECYPAVAHDEQGEDATHVNWMAIQE
ncbi:MAG: hypothetical protein ACREJP_07735, partial [Candidatus Methylomirabilales bacterium]